MFPLLKGHRCRVGQFPHPMNRRRRHTRDGTMSTMMHLKSWLGEQELTVREPALQLGVPLKTAQDWIYRGVAPSAENRDRLNDYIFLRCAHHLVIAAPNGPTSEGVCQCCGEKLEITNSVELTYLWTIRHRAKAQWLTWRWASPRATQNHMNQRRTKIECKSPAAW